MSHVERAVTCLHCQKVHDRGFIWNFSDTVRVCFTCYRVMGEAARKSYERKAARGKSKKAGAQTTGSTGYALKAMGILALLIVILGAGACFLSLTGEFAVQRVRAGESRMPTNQPAQKARLNPHSTSNSEALSPSPRNS
jgi:hypothetical protein